MSNIAVDGVGQATSKVPPSWGPEKRQIYTFNNWIDDIELWIGSTELPPTRQGPAIALQLTGEARLAIRQLEIQQIIHGAALAGAQGQPIQLTGVQVLLRFLRERYEVSVQTQALEAMQAYEMIRKSDRETYDEFLSRHDRLYLKAMQQAGYVLSAGGRAHKLFMHLGIKPDQALVLLQQHGGELPRTEESYRELVESIRRFLSHRHAHNVLNRGGHHQSHLSVPQAAFIGDGHVAPHESWLGHEPAPVHDIGHGQDSWHDGHHGEHHAGWHGDHDHARESAEEEEERAALGDSLELPPDIDPTSPEGAYLSFLVSRRRWKRFRRPGQSSSSSWRPGKGKGKSKSKSGKGKFAAFSEALENLQHTLAEVWETDSTDTGADGRGDSAFAGFPPRKNVVGADGKPLRCSICGSEWHLRARCTKGKGKGDGQNFAGISQTHSGPTSLPESVDFSGTHAHAWTTFTTMEPTQLPSAAASSWSALEDYLRCLESPNTISMDYDNMAATTQTVAREVDHGLRYSPPLARGVDRMAQLTPASFQAATEQADHHKASERTHHPAYPQTTSMEPRLPHGAEGLLLDIGSIKNISGTNWVDRNFGDHRQIPTTDEGQRIHGVGSASTESIGSNHFGLFAKGSETWRPISYKALVMKQADLPALYGLEEFDKQRLGLSTVENKLFIPRSADTPPLSCFIPQDMYDHVDLTRASSGHLMMPVVLP